MEKLVKSVVITIAALCLVTISQPKDCEASSKTLLTNKIKAKTSEEIKKVFYTDYDYDGSKEAFIITNRSDDAQTLWFSSPKEVKKIATAIIWTGKGRGICKVSKRQKLFLAEGSAGGSGSWSYCFYIKNGRAIQVKKAGEGLGQIKGKDFVIHPSAFDLVVDSTGVSTGHTWKAYYLKWNGKKFVEYVGKKMSLGALKKYKGANVYLKKVNNLGYKIREIYYRKNGIINVNLSKAMQDGIEQQNITFKVKGNKVSLQVNDKEGKNIVEKSSYGGRYNAKGFS